MICQCNVHIDGAGIISSDLTYLMLPYRLAKLVAQFVEHLLVVLGSDVRPQISQEAARRWRELKIGNGVQPERGRKICLEERLQDLVS